MGMTPDQMLREKERKRREASQPLPGERPAGGSSPRRSERDFPRSTRESRKRQLRWSDRPTDPSVRGEFGTAPRLRQSPEYQAASTNLDPVEPNGQLTTISLFGKKVTVLDKIVPRLKRIEKRWLALGGHDFYRINSVGGYADRNIANTNTKSQHAHGWAVDINPSRNPMGSTLVTDMPPEFVQLWLDEGFGWGGNWKSKKDAMHFSLAPHEGGQGAHTHADFSPVGPGQVQVSSQGVSPVTLDNEQLEALDLEGAPVEGLIEIESPMSFTAADVERVYEAFAGRRPDDWERERWLGRGVEDAVKGIGDLDESKAYRAANIMQDFSQAVRRV